MKRARILVGAVLLCLATTASVWGQGVSTAQIAGVVRDDSGGIIPGAEVTIVKTDTGMTRTTFTGADGSYILPNLPVGPYKLTVALQGFNTYVRDGIVLQVQSNPTIDCILSVGGLEENVTVVANASMVETRSTAVGQIIDNARVVEMPLNGRQVTELIYLSGLATAAPSGDLNSNKNYPTVTISVAGGQANGMTYIMDGGTHNDPFNNLNLPTPNPDALQEFKVETSALSARYGHHAASAVNVVTKSGSNQIHGNLFEFLRNYRFNSKQAFALAKDSLERNQFGGTIGAPIKRDRLFFFGSYQGNIQKTAPTTTRRYVPTQAMLDGDFTAFASPACNNGRQISLKAPFVNNRINPALYSQAALNVLDYVPVASDPCGLVQFGVPNNSTEHQGLGKLDFILSQNHTLSARYFAAEYDNPVEYDGKNVLQIDRTGRTNTVHSVVFGHNWITSSNSVNAFHATYNKTLNDRPLPEYFSPQDIGVNVIGSVPAYMGLSITGGFNLGSGGTNPGYFNSEAWQVADDFDYIKGKHQFAVGFSLIDTKIETVNNRPTNGAFSFNGSNTGLGWGDFLTGRMSSFMQGNAVYDYDEHVYFGAYIQDTYKPRTDLTINYGLRWEPFNPIQNTFGYSNSFSQEWFDAGKRSTVYPQAPAGLMFPGDEGYPDGKGTHGRRWAQVAPRLGVVWSPLEDNSMSVRGAWGIFYDTPHLFFNTRFANNPPWGAQISLTNPGGGFEDPFRDYPGGNPWPAMTNGWKEMPFAQWGIYVSTPLDLHNTRLHQWNLSVQKGWGDLLFAVSYIGNHSQYLWRAYEANPAIYSPGATTGTTNVRRTLYKANPDQGKYYATIGMLDDTGEANYHGVLMSGQKRMSNGWSILTNYTLSRCMADPATTEITGATTMNPADRDLDYSYCSSDRRHVWNTSLVARVPTLSNGVIGKILSDWQIAPIVRLQSGNRSTVTVGTDVALTGTSNQRPVQVLDDPYGDGTAANYLNIAAFAKPATGTYSTLKPYTIVNPGSFQNDISVSRSFGWGGRTLQFRWEVFNVINHVNLNAPTTAMNSSTFGQILSAGDPRIMQFALKFTF